MPRKVLCIGDIHFPAACKPALRRVIQAVKDKKPDVIVQMGDLFDRYSASSFPRSHNAMTPKKEDESSREQAEDFWENVKKASPYEFTFMSAFSNGYMHYGVPASYYDKGGYEATECFLAPKWQEIYEKTAAKIIKKL